MAMISLGRHIAGVAMLAIVLPAGRLIGLQYLPFLPKVFEIRNVKIRVYATLCKS
jgi:hypothetical protein